MVNVSDIWRLFSAVLALFWLSCGLAATSEIDPQLLQQLRSLSPQESGVILGDRLSDPLSPQRGGMAQQIPQAPLSQRSSASNSVMSKSPRISGGETILLWFTDEVSDEMPGSLLVKPDIRRPNRTLFVLDNGGGLTLNNIGRIVLAGLSEQEAAERIEAEPAFVGLDVTIKILPVAGGLKPFGYDLFTGEQEALKSVSDIPVPDNYVLGPGDIVLVQLFGKENVEYELQVTRNGMLLLPSIGPIPVTGFTFSELQQEIRNRISTQLIGIKASVTLGKLRSIRVFALGEAERPGSYVVSGLSTMTNALFASGGVKEIGSLRNIQLKRSGKIISRLDLYDLLLKGDISSNVRLLPGDVIFIPPVGKTVTMAGQVRRPAIYELKKEKSVIDLINIAGGVAPDAMLKEASIERFSSTGVRTMLELNLNLPDGKAMVLQDGDIVTIPSISSKLDNIVRLLGHVRRPGARQWIKGMRMTDLIGSMQALLPGADSRYVMIKRENPLDQRIEMLSTDFVNALAARGSQADTLLQPRDEVYVFDNHSDRSTIIGPMLDLMRYQTRPGSMYKEVEILGMVHHPGRYPVSSGMKVSMLLNAAGGLTDEAYILNAELTRFVVEDGQRRVQQRKEIDISAVIRGEQEGNIEIKPYDQLVIRRIPNWVEQGDFIISGEVRFAGTYPIGRGEKLSEMIRRAGGLTDEAYLRGAIFVRESVRLREQDQIESLTARLEQDLATMSVEGRDIGKDKGKAMSEGRVLLGQMKDAQALGRMVIKLEDILESPKTYNLTLQPGDKLFIPRKYEDVIVMGEIYHPTSHLYNKKFEVKDYIRLSGGVNEKGNKRAIYVVHVNGAVQQSNNVKIGPGDVIVIPYKLDRISTHQMVVDVSQILYQLALTAASLKVLNVF